MIRQTWTVARLDAADVRLLGHAFLTLARVRVSLWNQPWRRLCRSLRRPVRAVTGTVQPEVRRLAWAIRAASRWIPRATCLTRAVALQQLLAKFGYDAIVQIGIQHANGAFTAHAWTEHEGRPLLDVPADLLHYKRLCSFPASRSNPS
jgi:Transglutaminase-like superfamily